MPNRESNIRVRQRPRIVDGELSYGIVGCSFSVYNELGYGFTESVYARALQVALEAKGIRVEREVPIRVAFHGVDVGLYRIDMLVEGRIIVEIKSTERIPEVAKRQLRNYLSVAKLDLGLLLHFGPRAQYYRVLNGRRLDIPLQHSAPSPNSDE